MKPEMLKGHLDGLLLAVLAATGPLHGYAIIEELSRRSGGGFTLPEGTVYPALHRLEAEGLLGSHWLESAPRRRRVYELTARGRRALGHERDEWSEFVKAAESVWREAVSPARA
jgi:DNA-binding PadR family transcriptional regulator